MQQTTCSSCAHYKQHYAFNQRKIFRVYYGHCTYLKARARRPDSEVCENYTQGEPDEDAFVTKEYLSKELLKYVIQLELLPEIYGEATGK